MSAGAVPPATSYNRAKHAAHNRLTSLPAKDNTTHTGERGTNREANAPGQLQQKQTKTTRTHDDSDIHGVSLICGLQPKSQAPNQAKGDTASQCNMRHNDFEINGNEMDQIIMRQDDSSLQQQVTLIRELWPAKQPPHLAKCDGDQGSHLQKDIVTTEEKTKNPVYQIETLLPNLKGPGGTNSMVDWNQEPTATHNKPSSSQNQNGRDRKPYFHQQYDLHIRLQQKKQLLSEWEAFNQFLTKLHTIDPSITMYPWSSKETTGTPPAPALGCTIWVL